jgi:hypothetical protein
MPKDLIPNVVYSNFGAGLSVEEKETLKGVVDNFHPDENRELC